MARRKRRKKQVETTMPEGALTVPNVLGEAHKIIYGDREKTYGDPSKNLRCIGDYWTVHLKHKYGAEFKINVDDVCQMMVLLKQARLINDPKNRDGKVDTAGYIALMDRCQRA